MERVLVLACQAVLIEARILYACRRGSSMDIDAEIGMELEHGDRGDRN